MVKKIVVRKRFNKIKPIYLAFAIDAVDFIPNIIETIVSFFGFPIPVALTTNTVLDIIQGFVAFWVFDEPRIWGISTGAEVILPQGLDIFPSYTAMVLAIENGVV